MFFNLMLSLRQKTLTFRYSGQYHFFFKLETKNHNEMLLKFGLKCILHWLNGPLLHYYHSYKSTVHFWWSNLLRDLITFTSKNELIYFKLRIWQDILSRVFSIQDPTTYGFILLALNFQAKYSRLSTDRTFFEVFETFFVR